MELNRTPDLVTKFTIKPGLLYAQSFPLLLTNSSKSRNCHALWFEFPVVILKRALVL